MGELDAAARDIGLLVLAQFQREVGRDLLAGLVEAAVAGKDAAGEDQGLGARPACDEAALDQQLIEPGPAAQARARTWSTLALGSRVSRASAAMCLAFSSASSYMPTGVP